MTKYKLPEGFKITHIVSNGSQKFQVYNYLNQVWRECSSLKEVFEKIENYLAALEKIKNSELPNGYKIIVTELEYKFFLIDINGTVIMCSNSFEHLCSEVRNICEMNLQITALNNGEEIEI